MANIECQTKPQAALSSSEQKVVPKYKNKLKKAMMTTTTHAHIHTKAIQMYDSATETLLIFLVDFSILLSHFKFEKKKKTRETIRDQP